MDWSLVIPFDTDDCEFTRGVEVGLAFSQLIKPEGRALSMTMHVTNAEMALRLAESTSRHLRIDELPHGWMVAHFSEVMV